MKGDDMILESYYNSEYRKKINYILTLAYMMILCVLYISFTYSAVNNAQNQVKIDMRKTMDSFVTSMEADFKNKTIDIKYFSQDNVLKKTLVLNIMSQLQEYTIRSQKSTNSLKKIIILDEKNTVFFNSTGCIKDLSGINVSATPYSCYLYKDKVFLIHYSPIIDEGKRRGAVIAAYDFSDFQGSASKLLEEGNYQFYGIINDKVSFIMDKKGTYFVDKPTNKPMSDKLKEGFTHLIINGQRDLLLVKSIGVKNIKAPLKLSLVLPEYRYRQIETVYIVHTLKNCTIIAFIISVILVFSYFAFRYYTNKDFDKRLEIQSLRVQRHDIAKHLNIINIMAKTGEFEELTTYVESLSKKAAFENNLHKLDNPPVNALLLEKASEAQDNGIKFGVEVNAVIRDIYLDPLDLCALLANLIDNALDACKEITDLSLQKQIQIKIGYTEECYSFDISNTGNPIPEKFVQKIFKPGYSTKKGNKGRGMGLYIIARLIKKYRGSIEVKCKDGITTFIVTFWGRRA